MNTQSIRLTQDAPTATWHWLAQRVTAILLIPLSYWLVVLLNLAATAPYQTTLTWLTKPLNAIALGLWIATVFYHTALGLQVVIEDYVSTPEIQVWSIRAVYIILSLLALTALAVLIQIIL